MNLNSRKSNLVNWISNLNDENVVSRLEYIQKEGNNWWDNIAEVDKKAIDEGIAQLDRGEYLTETEVRAKVKERFNL